MVAPFIDGERTIKISGETWNQIHRTPSRGDVHGRRSLKVRTHSPKNIPHEKSLSQG